MYFKKLNKIHIIYNIKKKKELNDNTILILTIKSIDALKHE